MSGGTFGVNQLVVVVVLVLDVDVLVQINKSVVDDNFSFRSNS